MTEPMSFVDAEAEPVHPEASALVRYSAAPLTKYQNASLLVLSDREKEVLGKPVPTDKIKVRPDGGMIYLPGVFYRQVLREAFGPGQWALIRNEVRFDERDNMVFFDGSLYIRGCFVGEEVGEQEYFPRNGGMSYATAIAGARTNCIMRLVATYLGYSDELWEPDYSHAFLEQYAVKVWCINQKKPEARKQHEKTAQFMWRLKSDPPIDQWPWREEAKGSQPEPPKPQHDKPKPPSAPSGVSPDEQAARHAIIKSIQVLKGYLDKLGLTVPPKPSRMVGDVAALKTSTALKIADFQEYDLALLGVLIAEAKAMAEYTANDDLYTLAVASDNPKAIFEKMMELKAQEESDAV